MNNIEFKENAVCYADGQQWFLNTEMNKNQYQLSNENLDSSASFDWFLSQRDFQLNEPRQGDYIPKSELDTEQKYYDAVEVFGLFGYKPNSCFASYQDMYSEFAILIEDGKLYQESETYPPCKRKITYNQLMAIGKLKRLMNKRKSTPVSKVNRDIERVVKDKVNTELDKPFKISANKYEREISDRQGNSATVDVYDVLKAFEVTCPATQHAVKKLLCSGIRGHKDLSTDLTEAKESIVRAIELNG